MKYISLVLLLAASAMLHGQAGTGQGDVHTCTPQDTSGCISGNAASVTLPSLTLQPSGPMTFEISRGFGTPIITCGGSSDGKAKDCKIADGYTLDDAVNAVFETVKQQSDERQTELNQCWNHDQALYDIAIRENKAPKRCAAGLDDAAKQPPSGCAEGEHWVEKEHDKYGSHWICEKDAKP